MSEANFLLIGCGSMGSALIEGLSKSGRYSFSFYDAFPEKAEQLASRFHGKAVKHPKEASQPNTIFLLAIKPQDLASAATLLNDVKEGKMLVSVLTGISQKTLEKNFPSFPVLRMMPNLAVRSNEGILALVENANLPRKEVESLFSPLGLLKWMPEKHLDAMTSLIGSGPAFVCLCIEAMLDAGEKMGISSDDAYVLSKAMVRGTLSALDGTTPKKLIEQIASPNGTTQAGLRKLDEKKIRQGLTEAFLAAFERSKELAK